jgi:NAD(P)-dependent dehydrogenase (short-subunit alcohol dehydrogenase family)
MAASHPRRVMRGVLEALGTTASPCDRDTYTDKPEFPAVSGADTSNAMDFTGKHVFVIGGSRGIGASCVEMLARRGASVGFSFISNADAADALEVRSSPLRAATRSPHPWRSPRPPAPALLCLTPGIRAPWSQSAVADEGAGAAAGFKADVVSQAEMEAAMQASVAQFGRPLDGLVCSAGVFEPTPLAEWNSPYQGKEGTEAEFRRTMDVNIMGTILAVKAALQHWAPVGGSMVIITSTAGQRGSDIYSAYATSKGAQLMFSTRTSSGASLCAPIYNVPTVAPKPRSRAVLIRSCVAVHTCNRSIQIVRPDSALDGEGACAAAHSCELRGARMD